MASDGVEVARGIWHPPRSNAAMAASLLAEGARLSIRLEDGAIACRDDLKSVKVSDRIGSIPRRIGLSNGSLFETPDNDAIDRFLKMHKADRTGWIAGLEQVRPRLIGFVALVFLLAALIYRYALPALVEVAVLVTPPAVPQWLSAGTLASLPLKSDYMAGAVGLTRKFTFGENSPADLLARLLHRQAEEDPTN